MSNALETVNSGSVISAGKCGLSIFQTTLDLPKSITPKKTSASSTMTHAEYCKLMMKKNRGVARSKYKNKRVFYDNRWFGSIKEKDYYVKLKMLQAAGEIKEIICQFNFPLYVNDMKICTYRADFVVAWSDGRSEVIDVKGFKTEAYNLKKKLMKACHQIDIKEEKA